MVRSSGLLVAALLGLIAAGCASKQENLAPCPSARVLADPSELTRFAAGPGRDPTDIAFEASFVRVAGECRYDKDGGKIEIELTVVLDLREGPSNAGSDAGFAYFVALAHAAPESGSEPTILTRQAIPVDVDFAAGRIGLVYTDNLELAIARGDARDVRNYRLYLGFELTPDELAFNKRKFRR